MNTNLYLLILVLVLTSCNNDNFSIIERENMPSMIGVDKTDHEMKLAIKAANKTLSKFDKALQSSNPNFTDFSIKVWYYTQHGKEHLWVSDIKIHQGNYVGYIANTPEFTSEVNYGDSIQIDTKKISDWKYLDNGKLKGGYTIHAIRKHLSESEKAQFDASLGFIIDNENNM